jgi:hypothetical protein
MAGLSKLAKPSDGDEVLKSLVYYILKWSPKSTDVPV